MYSLFTNILLLTIFYCFLKKNNFSSAFFFLGVAVNGILVFQGEWN